VELVAPIVLRAGRSDREPDPLPLEPSFVQVHNGKASAGPVRVRANAGLLPAPFATGLEDRVAPLTLQFGPDLNQQAAADWADGLPHVLFGVCIGVRHASPRHGIGI
jgi:hypothetical protein